MSTVEIAYADIDQLVGRELGVSDWRPVDQVGVNEFAKLTGDAQWIHTDAARAASSQFGGTVAHGYLTLAMLPAMTREVLQVVGVNSVVNYGVNRVRFPRAVRVGRAVRDRISVRAVEANTTSKRLVLTHTIEINDGSTTPGCAAETISLLIPMPEEEATA